MLLSAAYVIGRKDGAAVVRQAARAAQLEANQAAIDTSSRAIATAAAVKATQDQRVDRSTAAHQAARSRIDIVDTMSVRVDSGPVLALPPPVLATIARSDTLIADLHADVVAADAWGAEWQRKAALLETRVGLLEDELHEGKRANRRTQIKTAIVSAAVGVLGAIVLLR